MAVAIIIAMTLAAVVSNCTVRGTTYHKTCSLDRF